MSWQDAPLLAASALLLASACAPQVTSVGAWEPVQEQPDMYLEAELGELSGAFSVGSDAAASQGRYIQPASGVTSDEEPGQARASYALEVPSDGEYVLWGRVHAPDAIDNRFWFQVDDGVWYKWRISVGEIWFWDDLHDDAHYGEPLRFVLSQGQHRLLFANCVDGIKLDRLYFTAQGDEPPGNDTPCEPPHSIEVAGACRPSCGSLAGTTCGADRCQGYPTLDAYDCDVCCRVEP